MGAILVYDITNDKSFESLEKWKDDIYQHADDNIKLMVLGNKLDIIQQRPQHRRVSKKVAREFA